MNTESKEKKAAGFLFVMVLAGAGLLAIPFLLTPPAYLAFEIRDGAFDTDLSKREVVITDVTTGKTMATPIQKIGKRFVARIGRINSGPGAYTARVTGYKPGTAKFNAAALQTLQVPLNLAPTFGRLEITTVNATRDDDPVAATVKDGTQTLTKEPQSRMVLDVPPGKHRLSGTAPGYCQVDREFDVREGKTTKAVLPLSPDLTDDEIARFVLNWRNEPNDLDTHFWRLDNSSYPSPTKVHFENKEGVLPNGATFARLDVDKRFPGAYETLTVRKAAEGAFRYYIHVYEGRGTISDAQASVQLYTRGCQVRTLIPPPNCDYRIWDIALLRNGPGGMELTEVQKCVPEGTISIRK